MRYMFTVPTVESMSRKAPRPNKPLTAEEVVAQNQRERSARQAGRRRLSPASSKKEDTKQDRIAGAGGGTTSKTADDGEANGWSGSESEDGYQSSSSTSSLDQRGPSTVREDVLSEAHGQVNASSKKKQAAEGNNGIELTTDGPPESLKPESHEYIIYLAGNSLGLQSKSSYQLVNEELMMWQTK